MASNAALTIRGVILFDLTDVSRIKLVFPDTAGPWIDCHHQSRHEPILTVWNGTTKVAQAKIRGMDLTADTDPGIVVPRLSGLPDFRLLSPAGAALDSALIASTGRVAATVTLPGGALDAASLSPEIWTFAGVTLGQLAGEVVWTAPQGGTVTLRDPNGKVVVSLPPGDLVVLGHFDHPEDANSPDPVPHPCSPVDGQIADVDFDWLNDLLVGEAQRTPGAGHDGRPRAAAESAHLDLLRRQLALRRDVLDLIAIVAVAGALIWLFGRRRRPVLPAPEDDVATPIDRHELDQAEHELAEDENPRSLHDGWDDEDDWGPGAA